MMKRDRDSLDRLLAMLAMMNFDMSVRTDGKRTWTVVFTEVKK